MTGYYRPLTLLHAFGWTRKAFPLTLGPFQSSGGVASFFNPDRVRNLRVFPEFRFLELESHCACGEVYFDVIGGSHNASFLAGGGTTAKLIASHDWSESLGPIKSWPASLKTTVGILLHSPVPIVLLWGEDGIMIYNDAYSVFAGGRHPQLLGSKVREGWPEVAEFNDNVMKVGMAGDTLSYRDQELTLHRSGAAEQVFMNLDYSPVFGEGGKAGGRHCRGR